MKPMCEWCGEDVYNIAILKNGKEELICKECFGKILEAEENKIPESKLSASMKSVTDYPQD